MLQWVCTFPYAASYPLPASGFPFVIWAFFHILLSTHHPPFPERTNICTLTSQAEQSSGKYMQKLHAPWPLHRFYKQHFSFRYQSVLPGSVLKKQNRTLTNLFTLSWEEKNLKTSAFLSSGLIVNYIGKRKKKKRKETQWREGKTKLKLLIPRQTSAHLHFSPGKQLFMPQCQESDAKVFCSKESEPGLLLHRFLICSRSRLC